MKKLSNSVTKPWITAIPAVLLFGFSLLPGRTQVLFCFDPCTGGFSWAAETHGDCREGLDCERGSFAGHAAAEAGGHHHAHHHDHDHDHDHHHHGAEHEHHDSDVVLVGNDDLLTQKESTAHRLVTGPAPFLLFVLQDDLLPAIQGRPFPVTLYATPPPSMHDDVGLRSIVLLT